jgi:hypothetical protein
MASRGSLFGLTHWLPLISKPAQIKNHGDISKLMVVRVALAVFPVFYLSQQLFQLIAKSLFPIHTREISQWGGYALGAWAIHYLFHQEVYRANLVLLKERFERENPPSIGLLTEIRNHPDVLALLKYTDLSKGDPAALKWIYTQGSEPMVEHNLSFESSSTLLEFNRSNECVLTWLLQRQNITLLKKTIDQKSLLLNQLSGQCQMILWRNVPVQLPLLSAEGFFKHLEEVTLPMIEALVKCGLNLNVQDLQYENTPLIEWSAIEPSLGKTFFSRILKLGADIAILNREGKSATDTDISSDQVVRRAAFDFHAQQQYLARLPR